MQPEILILGAGPGGLSTALHLAKIAPELIPRTLVLERAHHPRNKLCAGGLVVDAEIILQRLGLDVRELPHVDAQVAHLDFAGRGLTMRARRGHILRIIRRDEFDAWLARNAESRGIQIREGVTVKDVRPGKAGVLVETDAGEFSAQVVVGADGSKGVTRRSVQPGAGGHTARALELLTPVIASLVPSEARELGTEPRNLSSGKEALRRSGEPRAAEHHADHAYLDFFPVPAGIAGYVWDFPTQVNREPMRCWGIYDANLRPHAARPHLKAPLVDEMSRHGLDLNDHDLQGHPIHWFSPRNRVSAPRVLLVGDAAGVDGIFGEGISIALGHGQLAAQAIRDAFQRSDYSFRGYRPGLLLSPLGQALTARWMIMQILYHLRWRWFHWLLWRVLKPLVPAGGMRFVLSWARRMK